MILAVAYPMKIMPFAVDRAYQTLGSIRDLAPNRNSAAPNCALHDICGGGYLPHRYGAGREFQNPSIHCKDLWRLITHIISAASRACGQAPATAVGAQESNGSTGEASHS
jgi:hypothetical protein